MELKNPDRVGGGYLGGCFARRFGQVRQINWQRPVEWYVNGMLTDDRKGKTIPVDPMETIEWFRRQLEGPPGYQHSAWEREYVSARIRFGLYPNPPELRRQICNYLGIEC